MKPLKTHKMLLLSAALLASGIVASAQSLPENTQELKPRLVVMTDIGPADVEPDSTQHLSLLFGGDLMQHEPQIKAARQNDGSFDYSSYFSHIKPEIERADVAIANLEVTLGGKPYKGYPCFCAPDEYLMAIREAGFDVLTTSNNHCCDTRARGIERTIRMCDSLGVSHVGTYYNREQREKQYPFLLERNGFRIAILAFTYGTNGIEIPNGMEVNLIDTTQIITDIEKARAMNPDLILALPHWGIEYKLTPNKAMVELAQWLFNHGVDHVVGGHPHVVQPVELRTDSMSGEQHLIAYSLGNLVSDQSGFVKYGGMLLRVELDKAGPHQKPHISHCGYMLTFVGRPQWSGRKNFTIYPVDVNESLLTKIERQKRDEYLKTARTLFQEHNIGVEEYFMP